MGNMASVGVCGGGRKMAHSRTTKLSLSLCISDTQSLPEPP